MAAGLKRVIGKPIGYDDAVMLGRQGGDRPVLTARVERRELSPGAASN
jgi:hypothetical protein